MKIIITVILIILAILGYLFLSNNPKNESPVDFTLNSSENSSLDKVSGLFNFDSASSSIEWDGRKTLIKTWVDSGIISIKSGNIQVTDGAILSGDVVVDMTSITAQKTGSNGYEDKLSNHLKSADFFDVDKFATSSFVLISAKLDTETGIYNITGKMTIKGNTESISFPAKIYTSSDEKIILKGELVIDRTKFGVKYGSNSFFKDLGDKVIDDNFKLRLNLVGVK